MKMNFLETIGIIHVLFYSMLGAFFIGRNVYLTIKQRPEHQKLFAFKGDQ